MKKYLGWAAIAFVVFFLVTNPTAAATIVHNAIHGLGNVAHGLSTFVSGLR
jgi:hypothetical protein